VFHGVPGVPSAAPPTLTNIYIGGVNTTELTFCKHERLIMYTAEPKTPGVPWCFEFFVPNIKHKGTPRILSKLLKPRTSLVFRGVLKPTKFFMS
jgi:hypothetical protein